MLEKTQSKAIVIEKLDNEKRALSTFKREQNELRMQVVLNQSSLLSAQRRDTSVGKVGAKEEKIGTIRATVLKSRSEMREAKSS